MIFDHGPAKKPRPIRTVAAVIASSYLVITCLWIYFSSFWLVRLADGHLDRLAEYQRYKGFGFMLVTGIAFYFALVAVMRATNESARALHETNERWAEAERQATPALLASCIAHDVANLLTVMRLNVEKVRRAEGPAPVEVIARLDNGVDRLNDLVKRLRGASSSLFHEKPSRFDFSRTVEETLALMQTHVCCETATVELIPFEGAQLCGYPVLVHQLVMNLLINAAEATGRVGHVRFQVLPEEGGVALVVEDNGPGIAPSLREKVLGAYFTTKSTGTGLGLTSVRSCVDIHKGTLRIDDSKELGGARFTLTLPDLTEQRFQELRNPEPVLRARSEAIYN